MDVSNMLAEDARLDKIPQNLSGIQQEQNHIHQYSTRRSLSAHNNMEVQESLLPTQPNGFMDGNRVTSLSPAMNGPRNITFELMFEGDPKARGRLNLRVQIWPHDTTESIVTTVKNFFGLYDGAIHGISFEDDAGYTLIASYDNFKNGMRAYVRVISDVPHPSNTHVYRSTSPQRLHSIEDNMPMLPPQQILNYGQNPTRPDSRLSQIQTTSPKLGQGKPLPMGAKNKPRSTIKGQGSSFQASLDELNGEAHNDYSSSDGGAGSVSSSRRARSEQLASAEISVDNIVEGGRRKRAKFESSELPLYVPPQVPAPNSISSVSPQRRSNGADMASPFPRPPQRTFSYSIPMPSPQAYGPVERSAASMPVDSPFQVPAVPNHGHRLRDRTSGTSLSTRSSLGSTPRLYGSNVLPTPDPTIASCISDEDVALQLMRLGEVSNFSHGRTSASTLDDALSGRAEVASSATSDDDDNDSDGTQAPDGVDSRNGSHPPAKKQRMYQDEHPSLEYDYVSEDDVDRSAHHSLDEQLKEKPKAPKAKKPRTGSGSTKSMKLPKLTNHKKVKTFGMQQPMSPASLPSQSRKASAASNINFQHQLGVDEDDLSSKPRCQRCRKSKKGCDRQRPCQRCKDAGISVDGCVSEDEGNGRKGRYGRHMGVPVKKEGDTMSIDTEFDTASASAILTGMASGQNSPDKSKKRKR